MFIAIKTDDGKIKGKISFYCRAFHVSRQAFNKYLKTKATPWKYQPLADAMVAICREDECNDTYGRTLQCRFHNTSQHLSCRSDGIH